MFDHENPPKTTTKTPSNSTFERVIRISFKIDKTRLEDRIEPVIIELQHVRTCLKFADPENFGGSNGLLPFNSTNVKPLQNKSHN
jgi:hypothetical protein